MTQPRDFFISRAGADKETAMWIARTLEAAGLTCVIQDRDFRLGALFPQSMEQAFSNCRAMIAVLSPDYTASRYCTDEWAVAYKLDRNAGGGKLLPVRAKAGSMPALAEATSYVDLVDLPEPVMAQRLQAAVTAFREGGKLPEQLKPETAAATNSNFATASFTGRDAELSAIHSILWDGENANSRCAVIVGLGGVGKSAIAREYARSRLQRYSGAWFVRAETEATLLGDLADLGYKLNRGFRVSEVRAGAKAGVREAQTLARQTSKPFLLVFDNAEKSTSLPEWAHGEGLHLVATSRWGSWPSGVRTIELDTLPSDAARALLLECANRKDGDGLDPMLQALGGLPLAIVQAGAYLRENPSETFADYTTAHARRLAEAPDAWDPNERLVAATFAPSIEQARTKAPGADELLRAAAFFAPENIPLVLLSSDANSEQTRKAADALLRYSLWRSGEDTVFDPSRSVHRVLQAVMRDNLSDEERKAQAIACAERLSAQFDLRSDDPRNWPKVKPLSSHAAALSEATPDAAANPTLARALSAAGTYFLERADYASAEPVLKRALEIDERILGGESSEVARDCIAFGQLMQATDRFSEAEPLMRRALAIDEKRSGSHHPNVARDIFHLGRLLHENDRFDEGARLFRRALEIDEKTMGPKHPDVARDLIYLGKVLQDDDQFEEATAAMRRAVEIDEALNDRDHPYVARDLMCYGELLQQRDKLAEAEPLMKRALAIDEKRHGANHPFVARDLISLGRLYWDQDRLGEAETLMRRALEIDERMLGAHHTDVARDLVCLARVLQDADRLAEAEPLMRRALEIDEGKHGPTHTDVARDLVALSRLLWEADRFEEAEPLMTRALEIDEQIQGRSHTDVARDLIAVAELLLETDRAKQAESLVRRALAIDEARYGAVDSDVSRDLLVLGRVLHATHHLGDAETAIRRALEIDEKLNPQVHADVARDLNALGELLCGAKRFKEAEACLRRGLKIDEQLYGAQHSDVARDLASLANVLEQTKRQSEADKLTARANRIYEAKARPGARQTSAVRSALPNGAAGAPLGSAARRAESAGVGPLLFNFVFGARPQSKRQGQ